MNSDQGWSDRRPGSRTTRRRRTDAYTASGRAATHRASARGKANILDATSVPGEILPSNLFRCGYFHLTGGDFMSVLSSLHQFSDWGLLALRLGVGTVFLLHGNQKRAMWKMQPSAQLPAGLLSLLRVLSIAEPLGGLATLVGLLTQAAAAGFILVMLGAIRLKVLQMHKGFTGEGGWKFALDRLLFGI